MNNIMINDTKNEKLNNYIILNIYIEFYVKFKFV